LELVVWVWKSAGFDRRFFHATPFSDRARDDKLTGKALLPQGHERDEALENLLCYAAPLPDTY